MHMYMFSHAQCVMHMVSTVSTYLHSIWTPPTSMDSIDLWTQYKTRAFSPLSMLLRDEHARSNQYPRQPAQNAACLPIALATRELGASASATSRGVTSNRYQHQHFH